MYKIMLRLNQGLTKKKFAAILLFSASQNGNKTGWFTSKLCLSNVKIHELFDDHEHGFS